MLAIHFGNRHGSDADIFVLLSNDSQYGNTNFETLDITHIGVSKIEKLILGLDPILTEPFLTGEVIFGNEFLVEDVKKRLIIRPESCPYLFQFSVILYNWALWFIERNDLRKGLINFSFSCSYALLAYEYSSKKTVTTYNEISKKHSILRELKEKVRSHGSINKIEVDEIRIDLFNLLTKTRNKLKST